MLRLRRHLPAAGAIAGAATMLAALTGVATPAAAAPTSAVSRSAAASHYALTLAPNWNGRTVVVRWAPCTTIGGVTQNHVIRYRINPAGKAGRVRLVKRGVAKLSAATGLTFHYVGTTAYIPHANSAGQYAAHEQELKAGVPLVVAWALQGTGAGHSNLLTGNEAGVGTISWKSNAESQLRILDAGVVIKRGATSTLKRGYRAGGSIGALMLHELGHAVGLQHVVDRHQEMYPIIGPDSPAGYGTGDLSGLAKVGRKAGCMTTPALPV